MQQQKAPAAQALPLAVDLDGTLIRTDLFIEAILRFIFANPLHLFVLAAWMTKGRAYAKARLAERAPCDPQSLPYNEPFLEWVREERGRGRPITLATASDERAARAVAEHLGLFDDVFASDGAVNLKAARKAERLAAAFPDGFAYAGNESADHKVWQAAEAAVVVNAAPALVRSAARSFPVERSFEREASWPRALLKAIRPQQWSKNILVFLPIILAHAWTNIPAWLAAAQAFAALSLTASSVYLVNDAADIDADRRHHRKRNRPFASGALSPVTGLSVAIVLACAGLVMAASAGVIGLVGAYLVTTTAYSFWLKRIQLIDVFVLAGLYMIRVVTGGVASAYAPSNWLLAFCCFFFFSLALAKRVIEVDAAARRGDVISRRGYLPSDGIILKMFGVGAGLVSCLVLAFYLESDAVRAAYGEPFLLWTLPAGVMFWLCRVWLLAHRGDMHDDPLVFAAHDRVSWLTALVIAAGFAAAILLPDTVVAWPHH